MRIIRIWTFLILSLILIGCENKEKGTDQYPKTVYNDKYDNAIIMINDSIMVGALDKIVRDGKYLQDAVDWFKYNHINLYSVNYNPEPVSSSPKLYCDYYIDDRNIGTPLTDKGYVDWNKMLVLLRQKNLL